MKGIGTLLTHGIGWIALGTVCLVPLGLGIEALHERQVANEPHPIIVQGIEAVTGKEIHQAAQVCHDSLPGHVVSIQDNGGHEVVVTIQREKGQAQCYVQLGQLESVVLP